MSDTIQPALKWPGSKRWMVDRLSELYAPHRKRWFIDLFTGSGAAVLGVRPDRAVMNDANPHVMNFHKWVRMGLCIDHDMARGIDGLVVPLVNNSATYYAHRKRFNDLIDAGQSNTQEAALLFWYMNRTGFNGLCRFNRGGHFNTPFGRYAKLDYAGYAVKFHQIGRAMQTWRLLSRDFAAVPSKPGDFLYADPPYDNEKSAGFTSYAAGGFGWHDQVRLADFLARHDGPVVASNAATERIIDLYRERGFAVETVQVRRSISCKGSERKPALEMIATKGVKR
jgi:DNA adenine methylase